MRIALLTCARTFAGAEQGVADLAQVLTTRGHEVVVLCLDDQTANVYRPRLRGAAIASLHVPDIAAPLTHRDWRRVFAGTSARADVAVFSKATLNQVSVAFDRAVKDWFGRLVTIENLQPPPVPPPSRRKVLGVIPRPELWRRRVIKRGRARSVHPDHIVVCSRAVKQDLVGMYGFDARKITPVTLGVDTIRFSPNPAARAAGRGALGYTDADFVIGTIRRVAHEKGIDLAIEAVAALVTRAPNAPLRLVIAGDGPERAGLEEGVRTRGLEAHVRFVGYVSNPEDWYPVFDAFVIPSRVEALGIVALEAMAAGVPVIATRVGGLSEVFEGGSAGRVVQPDVESLATAMRELLELPKNALEEEGAAGRRHVAARYELTGQYSKMAAIIESVAGRDGVRPARIPTG